MENKGIEEEIQALKDERQGLLDDLLLSKRNEIRLRGAFANLRADLVRVHANLGTIVSRNKGQRKIRDDAMSTLFRWIKDKY